MQSQAKTLSAQIPGATVVQTSLVSAVTLKLGTDGQQVDRPRRHRRRRPVGRPQHVERVDRRTSRSAPACRTWPTSPAASTERPDWRGAEALFATLLAEQPSRPFVTFYDDATGERVELSARSLANWVAKTHFLLLDELGLGVGDTALVALPADWITVPILLGCWSAGLSGHRPTRRARPSPS